MYDNEFQAIFSSQHDNQKNSIYSETFPKCRDNQGSLLDNFLGLTLKIVNALIWHLKRINSDQSG